MNVLLVYTHPNHQSLSYAFLQKVIQGSRDNPRITEIEVLDLYEEGFDPVLVFNENKRRRDMHADPRLEKHRQQLLRADLIVFVYPIWWGRPPAMLLGYIDQMFAAGFAYRDRGGLFPEGLLKGKSVVCISTMKGPARYPLLWLHDAHKVLMRKALFRFVGIKKVKFFEFGSMESPKGRHEKKLERVYRHFQSLAR
ncbi:NAD(P)H-dependent oxidoreductase [Cohnella zeiphila]|uniref:NAD(P)H-dependent oxidoreductase n=1 Tax=Cohnella zeiphila TaxID=2761120 RepID=A0A7X0VX96_9BACL|nr:NAD(P)H-dependent oxidoreductase [Cohnella zeiphila]MBB6733222.1 NAD(P)H-dependent oxidoreductase [Cohnella zeiphila]